MAGLVAYDDSDGSGSESDGGGGMVSYGNDDEDDQNDMSMSTTVINALKAKAQLQLLSEEKEPEGPADAAGPACSSILPPRPQGAAPDSVTKAINTLKRQYEMANESLNSKKTRNPSILEKLVDHLGINETGTNCDKGTFDPERWGDADYGEALSKAQQKRSVVRSKPRPEVKADQNAVMSNVAALAKQAIIGKQAK